MHHIVLERWSRGRSALHRRDARAKIVALLVFLVALATAERAIPQLAAALFLLLCAALVWARIPVLAAMARAGVALPFAATFAAVSWISGDAARGAILAVKSYLSALAVVTVVATTPLPALLRGLETMRVPRFLLTVAQFLYRYLFVVSEEGQHMAKAAAARGASAGRLRFRVAAGALAVLFARSYGRAQEIHGAMLARGYNGRLPTAAAPRFGASDAVFLASASLAPALVRIALDRFA
ncbi:MAG: energy-coupling factor transporter transmembrane protein EcfT [Acidobacteriia bacterium]|nr:energy-coupling factor transporter transmembrane protein EcfT [Terriglobia bacterium]